MAEAILIDSTPGLEERSILLAGSLSAGEVIQAPDGRAGVAVTAKDAASGDYATLRMTGRHQLTAVASKTYLRGSQVFWDVSANALLLTPGAADDFAVGVVATTKTTTATDLGVIVDLNATPKYIASYTGASGSKRGPVIQQTLAGGVFSFAEWLALRLSATSAAEVASFLSGGGLVTAEKGMLDLFICVQDDGGSNGGVIDASFGLANDDHASDADSITESLLVHLDGNVLNIYIESDDNASGEVSAADSTVDLVLGTVFRVQFDLSDWADIQVYIDGVNVLPSSTFTLSGVTGPLKLIAMVEKSSGDSPALYFASGGLIRYEDKGASWSA